MSKRQQNSTNSRNMHKTYVSYIKQQAIGLSPTACCATIFLYDIERYSLSFYSEMIVYSTRRFLARPSSVSLVAIGCVRPMPAVSMRSDATPR